ncbi:hypothetical protein CEUSTIGMA_g4619.t1 [Chlamydomonas eustigma]|uniref:Uncharacterized protein n=1 Tax=Chlamydomonas eustigma TaxID=1157962 RepID=A0A250X249_9CHLO|nr:hypothetical protein CEUSTIGMA_g4619.t1 [Chlamydomonas eustigma]|eukprot:GAX77174.1 hypothetical protein CEUSTIGMA_g4619.t1 [Chlamydomonas eustigma]
MTRTSFQEEDLRKDTPKAIPIAREKTEEEPLTKYDKLKKFLVDVYAVREIPTTLVGGFITLFVILATLAYLAVILYQTLTAPLLQTASLYWTIGAGPFPAQLVCTAYDGCYVSNLLSVEWATGIALSVEPAQRQCMFMSYGQTYTFNITFSNSPLDGLQVIYNGTNVDTSKVPAGFGALINSQANCFGEGLGPPECVNGVQIVPSPVGPGFTLLTYVETHNLTISNGPASLRREWFLGKFSNESVVVPGSTPCLSTLSQSLLTDLNMVQARLRFNTFYTVQTVSKSNLFLVVFGSVGGAYSLFIQFGSVVISLMSIWIVISAKTQVIKEKVVRSLTLPLSMRRPSLRGNKVMVHDESDLMEKGNGHDDADKEEIEFQRYLSQTSKNTNQNSKEIASTAASTVGGIGVN